MNQTPDLALSARDEDFGKIVEILKQQQGRKLDVIAPASTISVDPANGDLLVSGTEAVLDESGVTPADGRYTPTDVFWDGVTDKLQIPRAYLRRMVEHRPDLLAATVNGWLHGKDAGQCGACARSGVGACDDFPDCPAGGKGGYPADSRNFLIRLFRGDDGGTGVARAMLSDTYRLSMDNLDVLTAALSGVKETGTEIDITSCDLTERRLHVRMEAPAVRAAAPILLAGYRNPFANPGLKRAGSRWSLDSARAAAQREGQAYEVGSEPIVSAGFDITNSETGGGAYRLTPFIKVKICGNALVLEVDSVRQVHLGQRMDAGLFQVGEDTQRKETELIALRARDAVKTWLDVAWLESQVAKLEAKAVTPIDGGQVAETVTAVTKQLQFTAPEQAGVLSHFIAGGALNAGGVMQAVTSFAQTVEDADRAFDIERSGIAALDAAYKLAS